MAAADVYADLAGRGITLSVRDDGRLWVAPGELLTDADRTAIRTHRDQLLDLAATRTVADRLDARSIPTCRICRNDRGAHVGDDRLCACCRAYTRRFGDPQDPGR